MEFKLGDAIQFRRAGGWNPDEQGEWESGTFENESTRCISVKVATGHVYEFWKHRVEIRKAI